MKKMSKVLFLGFAILGCNKPDVEEGTPECVVNNIKAFEDSSFCTNAKVDEFTFRVIRFIHLNPEIVALT